MPKVSVQVETKLDQKQCFSKVTAVLSNDAALKKIDPEYSSSFDDKACTGQVKGKQFKADVQVKSQGGGSVVSVDVDLPMTLGLFKGMIEKNLKQKLAEVLS